MTNAKHTPGPWQYGHVGTEALWIGPDYNKTPVAHVDHDTEYARDNSRANARLIAAAPELLEALREAEGELYQVPPADAEQERVLAVVRAAIAKAEGR